VNDPDRVHLFQTVWCDNCAERCHVEEKIYPSVINGAEVFDSEGTMALQVAGRDVLHLVRLCDDEGHPLLTPEEHDKILALIIEALGIHEKEK
jgi:hypothetical protein